MAILFSNEIMDAVVKELHKATGFSPNNNGILQRKNF